MECSNCRKEYSGGELGLPLLLQCGCTYCNSCLQQLSRRSTAIKCPKCGLLTAIRKDVRLETQLPPNIYLLGLARAKELGLHRFGSKSGLWKQVLFKEHKRSKPVRHRHKTGEGVQQLCNECRHSMAVFHCQQCTGFFCYGCFRVVHMTSRVLREHTPKPLSRDAETPPTTCSRHPGKALVGMCEEEELLVCTACAESRSHRGHTHLSIAEAAVKWREAVSPVLSSSRLVLQEAGRTCKVLARVLPEWQQKVKKDLEAFSATLLQLHGRLQLRELEVWQQVATSYAQLHLPALAALEAVEEGECEVRELLEDTETAMKDDWSCVNTATSLLNKLDHAHSLPARTNVKQYIGIKLRMDVDKAVEWVGQLCDVKLEEGPNVELLTVAGEPLPPDLSLMKPISSSSSTVSSLPPSSPSKQAPSRSGQSLGDQDQDQESVSSRSTSLSPVPQQVVQRSPRRGDGTSSSSVSQSSSGGDIHLVEVEVVHVVDPDHIYVREASQSRAFDQLQERVAHCCHQEYDPIQETDLKLGFLCAGQDLDGIWYRVIIIDVTRDCTAATVQLVDCGKTCLLPVARLSVLSSSLRVCPPQVSHCRLHAIVNPSKSGMSEATPVKWRDIVTSIIKESVTDKVSIKVFERSYFGVLYVDLFTGPRLLSLCNKLVVGGLAVRTHSRPHLLEGVVPPPLQLGVGDSLQVQVMAAQTPWDFYFQDASNYCYDECDQLKVKLETAYRHGSLPLVGVPLLNMYVAARFSEDQQLYRAKVIEVFENGNLKLLFVDYGNTEVVYMDYVYKLPEDILRIKQQAVHARLHMVHPVSGEEWSEDSSDFFHALCDGRDLQVVVREAPSSGMGQQSPEESPVTVSLTLKAEGGDQDIAGLMIAAKKAAAEATPIKNFNKVAAAKPSVLEESDSSLVSTKAGISTASSTTPTISNYNTNSPLLQDLKSSNLELLTPTSISTPSTPIFTEITPTSKPVTPTPVAVPKSGNPLDSSVPTVRRSSPLTLTNRAVSVSSVSSRASAGSAGVREPHPRSSTDSVATLVALDSSEEDPFSDVAKVTSSDSSPSVGVTSDQASSQVSSVSSQSSPIRSPSDRSVSGSDPPHPVGRAAWRSSQRVSAAVAQPFAGPAGRAVHRRRVKSSRVVGHASILPDQSAPPPTGRSASTPPSHPPTSLTSDKNKLPKDQSPARDQFHPSAPPTATPSFPPGLTSIPPSKSHYLMLPSPLLPVQVGGTFKCRVVYVRSPELFFIHVKDDNSDAGGVMSLLAMSQQDLHEVPVLTRLEKGQLAMARYEGMWHRVLCQGPGSTPQLQLVLYVDYGNMDEVEVLKPVPLGLAKFPPQALQCRLHKPQNKLSRDKFCRMVAQKTLTAVLKRVVDGVMEVSLKELELKTSLPNHFILPVPGTS